MPARGSISLSSAAPGPLYFAGGRVLVSCSATFGGGSVSLEGELPDGTYGIIPDRAGAAVTFSAAGFATADLAPGQYKLSIATATDVAVAIVSAE